MSTPQEPAPDTETQPGDVPQGPQETNPDADEPDLPLDSGQEPDSEAAPGI